LTISSTATVSGCISCAGVEAVSVGRILAAGDNNVPTGYVSCTAVTD